MLRGDGNLIKTFYIPWLQSPDVLESLGSSFYT
jgi:hypothetical protein